MRGDLTSKLENSPESYSEINARKALYKRVRPETDQIADFIPEEGWVNTTNVSRECESKLTKTASSRSGATARISMTTMCNS